MSTGKAGALRTTLANWPLTLAVVEDLLRVWPEHADYLAKNFARRSTALLGAGEAASAAIRKLTQGAGQQFAADYRWTCDRLRDEEIYFHREGRYRLSTFAAASAEVYSDDAYMTRYMHGLLLSQIFWYNHIGTFEMFLNRVLGSALVPFDYLEVGPGHGLMLYFASQSLLARRLEAWDVSAASLRKTSEALQLLGASREVTLAQVDILQAEPPQRSYDLVVISEVLEHLEAPLDALRFLHEVVAPDGRIFINVPINSPSPDHIYLFSSPEEIVSLVREAGLTVESMELFATQGRDIESALRTRISVSAAIVARRTD